MQADLHSTVTKLLSLMGFTNTDAEVVDLDEGIEVNISAQPEDSGILIGRHGEGVDALQLVVNLIANNNQEEWQRISVNVNDYRQNREETIKSIAQRAAENVKLTGKAVILNYLPSHERRIAHMFLDQDQGVQTHSEGEGKYRRLVISPASS